MTTGSLKSAKIKPVQIAKMVMRSNPYPTRHMELANMNWYNWWHHVVEILPLKVLRELMYMVDPKEDCAVAGAIIAEVEKKYGDKMFGNVWKDDFAKEILAYRKTVKNYYRSSVNRLR